MKFPTWGGPQGIPHTAEVVSCALYLQILGGTFQKSLLNFSFIKYIFL